jgi:molecular chaperone IbpA
MIRNVSNNDLFKDLEWMLESTETKKVRRYPLTNLGIDENETLIIEVACAGFGVNDIDISTSGNELIIEGTNPKSEDAQKNEIEYFQKHISSENFKRIIRLGDEYIQGEIDAKYRNGILTISIKKNEPEKKLVEIKEL